LTYFSMLVTRRLCVLMSCLPCLSFVLFVCYDSWSASLLDCANAVAPLLERSGTRFVFNLTLPGSGQYHVVAVDVPAQQELQVHLNLVAVGLKTGDAVVAIIVLVGGLALVAASLMPSVWSW